jgi:hypothetical protein
MHGGFWKNIIAVHQHRDLPLGQSDMFFQQLNTNMYSPVTAGTMSANCFLAKKGTDGSAVGRGCRRWRRTAESSAREPRSLAVANLVRVLSLPWGRGLKLRMTEMGRSRRSRTVWRRRSLGSPAAGKIRYGGSLENIPVPNIFCGSATRSMCPIHPSPSRYPIIDRLHQEVCLARVIVTAHCS